MTFLDLQNLVLSWLDDKDAGYFTRPEIKLWLNNAQKELQKRLLLANQDYYMKPVQTTLVVNQADYVLPMDFMKEHRLEIVVSGTPPNESVEPLGYITTNQRDAVSSIPGQPACYSLKKNRVTVYPPPNTALIMRLYYSPMVPDMMLDVEIPDAPYHYHEYMAVLATVDGYLKDQRDATPMIVEKRNYYETLLKQDAAERRLDASRSIILTGENTGYYGGFY